MSTDAEEQAMEFGGDAGCEEQQCDQEQEYAETNLIGIEAWL